MSLQLYYDTNTWSIKGAVIDSSLDIALRLRFEGPGSEDIASDLCDIDDLSILLIDRRAKHQERTVHALLVDEYTISSVGVDIPAGLSLPKNMGLCIIERIP